MGLRINLNLGTLTAIRTLQSTSAKEISILERLSTARSINRASDNPAAFVSLSALTGEISATSRSAENIQNAISLFNVAEAGLSEINTLIEGLQGNILQSMNTGVLPQEARDALQSQIDQTVGAINRIASTTRFSSRNILNGQLAFEVDNKSPQLTRVNVTQASVPEGGSNVNINVTSPATRAQAEGTIATSQSEAVTVRILGPLGTADVNIQAGATREQVVAAINSFSEQTGVEATSDGVIRSIDYGSKAFVRVENVQGSLQGITAGYTRGTDVVAQVSGIQITGVANTLNINVGSLAAQVDIQAGASGNFSFTIKGGGAIIQTGPEPTDKVTIGISSSQSAVLGTSSGLGNLQSITTGSSNNILDNPATALSIINAARNEITSLRSQLGSASTSLLEPMMRNLETNVVNLSQARSVIGDADFAKEIADLLRTRIYREAGLNALKNQNLSAGAVLNLLA